MAKEQTAEQAFLANHSRLGDLLAKLQKAHEDHFEVNPEAIHWGHVGSMGKACEDLEELCRFLNV